MHKQKTLISIIYDDRASKPFSTGKGTIIVPVASRSCLLSSVDNIEVAQEKYVRISKHTDYQLIVEVYRTSPGTKGPTAYIFTRTGRSKFSLKVKDLEKPWWLSHYHTSIKTKRNYQGCILDLVSIPAYHSASVMVIDSSIIYFWQKDSWVLLTDKIQVPQEIVEEIEMLGSINSITKLPSSIYDFRSLEALLIGTFGIGKPIPNFSALSYNIIVY